MHQFTYVPTTDVVAVVVDGFIVGKFWFFAPLEVMAGIGPACKDAGITCFDQFWVLSSYSPKFLFQQERT